MTLSLYAMSRPPFSLVIWARPARCAADQYNQRGIESAAINDRNWPPPARLNGCSEARPSRRLCALGPIEAEPSRKCTALRWRDHAIRNARDLVLDVCTSDMAR